MSKAGMTICLAVVSLALAPAAHGFELTGNEHLNVTTSYARGFLYDSSTTDVLEGGYIGYVEIFGAASLRVLEYRYGTYGRNIECAYAYDNSSVNVSGGDVGYLCTYGSSVNLSGGNMETLSARDNSSVNISGGSIGGSLSSIVIAVLSSLAAA